jgi:hypothetical protein
MYQLEAQLMDDPDAAWLPLGVHRDFNDVYDVASQLYQLTNVRAVRVVNLTPDANEPDVLVTMEKTYGA